MDLTRPDKTACVWRNKQQHELKNVAQLSNLRLRIMWLQVKNTHHRTVSMVEVAE